MYYIIYVIVGTGLKEKDNSIFIVLYESYLQSSHLMNIDN